MTIIVQVFCLWPMMIISSLLYAAIFDHVIIIICVFCQCMMIFFSLLYAAIFDHMTIIILVFL